MPPFHVNIYAVPGGASRGKAMTVGGGEFTPLVAAPSELVSSWPITFDEAADALATLPRMFLEPDGSFVWVGGEGSAAWQLDGVLYDQGPRLAYVELKGHCDAAALEAFLDALGWPQTPLVFELVPQSVVLDEADFRRVAGIAP